MCVWYPLPVIIKCKAYPRAGLVGNPSDGYFGKTIAFVFSNFSACVTLYESPELEIVPNTRDHSCFQSLESLSQDVHLHGYYGGIRLLKATLKRFYDYCVETRIDLEKKNCTIRYQSDIPTHVGLAGSSAIITACLRALMEFYGVRIPPPQQANLILSVERDELKIPAGLQDRVAQVYEGVVYMDFAREEMERRGHGIYRQIAPDLLPPLYVAYRRDLAEGSEVFHHDIRVRFNRGDPEVVDAMRFWAGLTDQVYDCLLQGRQEQIGALLDANFDMRRKIYKLSPGNLAMVDTARSLGASAKFTGSGGAIIGTYADEAMFNRLAEALAPLSVDVFKPTLVPAAAEGDGHACS